MHGEEGFPDGKGRPRNGNPAFYEMLDDMARIHDKKSHDYASNSNPSGNYHFAGEVAALFAHSPQDAGFAGRIAEKVFRLANLEAGNKTPKNESVEDTELDIAVITLLWMADRRERRNKPNALETEMFDLIKLMPDFQTEKIIQFIYDMREIRSRRDSNPGPEMSAEGKHVMNVMAGGGAYAKRATEVPNQGQSMVSPQVAEVLRLILRTNQRIQEMLRG